MPKVRECYIYNNTKKTLSLNNGEKAVMPKEKVYLDKLPQLKDLLDCPIRKIKKC